MTDTQGRSRAPLVANRVRKVDIGLSPLCPWARSGRLAAPDGLPAGRSGVVRRMAGQHGRTRAHQRGGRAQAQRRLAAAEAASAPRSTS